MKKLLLLALVAGLPLCLAQSKPAAPAAPTAQASPLPVRKVVLYKNGVGFFEHGGKAHGNQQFSVQFTNAQLDDVLKSLTVVDTGQGKVTGVRYDSVAPLAERIKSLHIPVDSSASSDAFLGALRGARVEVHSGTSIATGRILNVQQRTKSAGRDQEPIQVSELTLVTDGGEFRSFELGPATSVRVLDRELDKDISEYLNLMNSQRSTDLRRMVISTAGEGDRDLYVSYISEVPVWKSTYRIILPDKPDEKALLQGWAIVDNTVGEDWNNVELSLVAGAPQSFVTPISQPSYVRRPVVQMPGQMLLTPQSHEATLEQLPTRGRDMDALIKVAPGVAGGVGSGIGGGAYLKSGPNSGLAGEVTDPTGAIIAGATITARNTATGATATATSDSEGEFRLHVPAGEYDVSVTRQGFSPFRTRALVGSAATRLNAQLNVGQATQEVVVENTLGGVEESVTPDTTTQQIGDLFRYDLKQRITIGKDQSALVPIVQARIDAEQVTLWNASEPVPLRALWLTNSSGATLDAGTFNILEGGAFAGEGLIELLKPQERRLLSYAADTGVRITARDVSPPGPISRVRIAKGVMQLTREQSETKTYTIRNANTDARDVIIEHPARAQWKLAAGLKPEETTASYYRFRVKVPPDSTTNLDINETHPNEERWELTNVDSDLIELWLRNGTLSGSAVDSFHSVLAKKAEISGVDVALAKAQSQIRDISNDQARVRENMKALKGSAEEKVLLTRYAQQLNSQEDQLVALRAQVSSLQDKRTSLAGELDQMLTAITFEQDAPAPAK